MGPREPEEAFRPEWLVVALAALLPRRRSGRLEIHADGSVIGVDRGRVTLGPVTGPDAVVAGPSDVVLGVAAGELPISVLEISGDEGVATKLLGAGD